MSGTPSPSFIPNPHRPEFYDSRGQLGVSVCVAFSTLSLLVLSARLFTRAKIVRYVGIEDLIIVVSWLFAATFSALVVVQVSRGLGRHTWALTFDQYTSFGAPFWASICFYQLTITFTKTSILLQYFKIFPAGKVRRACWIVFSIVIAYGMWSVLSAIFMCRPVAFFWNKAIAGGHCLPEQPVWFGNSALNIATDISILVLPMPTFSKLNLAKPQKRALILVLALGGLVCIISMVRFESLYVISVSKDVSWDNVPIAYWTAIESNVGIICACLPSLKQFLSRYLPSFMNSGSNLLLGDAEDAWQQSRFGKPSMRRHGHNNVFTEASGPVFPMGRVALTVPLRAFTRHSKSIRCDITPAEMEDGGIKVVTAIEQDVNGKTENSKWPLD